MIDTSKLPKQWLDHFKKQPGAVYSFWRNKKCLYIGVSSNVINRLKSHFESDKTNIKKFKYFKKYTNEISFRIERLAPCKKLENDLIFQLQPKFNRYIPKETSTHLFNACPFNKCKCF